MRIIFMGTPDFATPALRALHAADHEVVAVYTQPPRRAGRGKKIMPSPIHLAADELGIEVHHPASLKEAEAQNAFAALSADVAIVAAYGLILPQAVLDAPRYGCINIHASLLPRWRGAAPVQRAILAGDDETGVTIMQMEAGLDTGPMLATTSTPIARKNAGELTDELAQMGAKLMVEVLADLSAFRPIIQPTEGTTYAAKIDKVESRLDFHQDANAVERQIRAFAPAPGAFFELEQERYRILSAEIVAGNGTPGAILDDQLTIACKQGAIRPILIQRAGKPVMAASALLRGRPIAPGTLLA